MSGLNSVKRWLRRNRKQYKRAIRNHLVPLSVGLDAEVREESQEVAVRSVHVGSKDLMKCNVIRRFSVQDDCLMEVAKRDKLILQHQQDKQILSAGRVEDATPDGTVRIKLRKRIDYTIKELNKDSMKRDDGTVVQDRIRIKFKKDEIKMRQRYIQRALDRFAKSSRNQYIMNFLLGSFSDATNIKHNKARLVVHKRLAKPFDNAQRLAVEESMKRRISLVEGVTGSGKSVVAANIAFSSSRLFGKKIMICSPVQSSLDQLADLLYDADINVVRMPPIAGDQDDELRPECSLDRLVDEAVYTRASRRLRNQVVGRLDYDTLNVRARRQILIASDFLKKKISRKLLRNADVICCTPVQAGHPLLEGINFKMLIIDDAHMISELDSMVPLMLRGLKQVTFLSEMRQDIRLSRRSDSMDQNDPSETENNIFSSDKRVLLKSERGFRSSSRAEPARIRLDPAIVREPGQLFERSLTMGLTAVALNHQVRMPKALAQIVNELFFAGRMRTDTKIVEFLRGSIDFHWLPKKSHPTALFDLTKSKFLTTSELVCNVIKKIESEEPEVADIGVIYNLPDAHAFRDGTEVGLVGDFVGREKDYIILACKPRTHLADYDFTRNDQALCVALTRARRGMFIVARLKAEQSWIKHKPNQIADSVQGSSSKWCRLIEYYKENNLVL